jgi:hypothetical protein
MPQNPAHGFLVGGQRRRADVFALRLNAILQGIDRLPAFGALLPEGKLAVVSAATA